jgi:hypothetical protein
MVEYLWCPVCEVVYTKKEWTKDGKMGIYGMCPRLCGTSGRKAMDWSVIAKRYGYPVEPRSGERYPTVKLF